MKNFIIAIIVSIFSLQGFGQELPEGTLLKKQGVVKNGYNFWVYEPGEYKTDKHPLPLIIFLHGASLCGRNMEKVRRYGTLDAIKRGYYMPMFVAAPQNPGGPWKPEKLLKMLDWMKENYAIDSTRVYVLGMSLGGYGTLDFVGTYPEKVAAGMALCGGTTLKDMSKMGEVPLWIVHGTADKAVSVKESKRVVQYLQESGNDKLLRFDWLQGGSHGLPARYFYMQKTYDWLLSHSTADNPRELDTMIEIEKEDLDEAYKDLREMKTYYEEY